MNRPVSPDGESSSSDTTSASERRETLASSVYEALLRDIVRGKLKPGQKLHLHTLKTDYNVGNSPLREALNRLSTNGMVVRQENKGFHVSPASVEELQELIRTRCWLEEIALRESIKNADDAYDERIVLAYHRLCKVNADDSQPYISPELEEKHSQFHLALLSECRSKILLGYCAQLQEQTLRYRNLAAVVEYRESNEGKEHLAIRNAIFERDADEAVKLLKAHYEMTAEIVISSGSLS